MNVPFILQSNKTKFNVTAVLSKYNLSDSETVQLCTEIIKINKRNKRQQRFFVLTNKAIYNLKSQHVKRRISLHKIAAITKASQSAEFTINIPSEYDYRFAAKDSVHQNEIISLISRAMTHLNCELLINTIKETATETWTVTKTNLKLLQHNNNIVRTVAALDHLSNMGFKSNVAYQYLKTNDGDLSCTIHALIGDYAKNETEAPSPFTSVSMTPCSIKLGRLSPSVSSTRCSVSSSSTNNGLSPVLSSTELVNDAFAIHADV